MVDKNSQLSVVGIPVEADRRQGGDRRNSGTSPLSLKSLRGKRSHGRRAQDLDGGYVDRHHPVQRLICLGIILLSCVDAFFTLRILELGGVEVNPVMKYLIEWDLWAFIYIKLLITSLCIAVLVTHIHFKCLQLIKVGHVLIACFAGYLVLICYEVYLLHLAYSDHFGVL